MLGSEGLQASEFILGEFEVRDIKLIKTTLWFETFNIIEAALDTYDI